MPFKAKYLKFREKSLKLTQIARAPTDFRRPALTRDPLTGPVAYGPNAHRR
jgi:hypothetical protein